MRPLLIMKIVMIAKFCLLTNILLCQESLLKNQFELSTTLATTRSGEPMITFKIANNSLDSIKVEPPEVGSSVIVYVLPNKEELESSIILCGPDVDFSVWLFPKQVQSFNIPIKQCQIMLNPYQKKFGKDATYQIYWKLYDGNYIEEKVYGRNGRFRIDRKPTYLKSAPLEIKL